MAIFATPRGLRPKLPIATLAALSLFAVAQALAPASAAAADDQDGCVSSMEWPDSETGGVECSKDGSGGDGSSGGGGGSSSEPNSCYAGDEDLEPGELVCVQSDAYVAGGRPLGSRPSPSIGREGDRISGARRGTGAAPRTAPPRKRSRPEPVEPWPPKRVKRRAMALRMHNTLVSCERLYLDIQRYYWEDSMLRSGGWGIGRYFLEKDPVNSGDFEKAVERWPGYCSNFGPVPRDET